MPIKVLVVDDSALIRNLLSQIIGSDPALTLIGCAPDAYVAKEMVKQFSPDVITLDIEMPKVNGLTFLDRLMKAKPTPVIMISTLTEEGADATFNALALGAIDFVPKPKLDSPQGIHDYQCFIINKIKAAAKANILKPKQATRPLTVIQPRMALSHTTIHQHVIAIGASTGGTEAILCVLKQLPAAMPAIVITQHMPSGFTKSFSERLNMHAKLTVKEAEEGERLKPGCAYLAPGDQHLEVVKSSGSYKIKLSQSAKVSGHRPSVDVMFQSLAHCAPKQTSALLLTGMGKDGAQGMHALYQRGSTTFAQNEASCVVFGMPKAAIQLHAVTHIGELTQLPEKLLEHLNRL